MAIMPILTVKSLYEYLDFLGVEGLPKHNLLLLGKHGIGKSRILEGYFANHPTFKDYPFHTLFLSQMADPGDLTGLPDKDIVNKVMKFLAPWWWNDTQPIIVFVDEILRARLELIQPFFSLALDKAIAGRKLHPQSVIISASNFGDEYQQTDADAAFGSRFTPFEFAPTPDEWIDYAVKAKYDSRIVNFIRENRAQLDGERGDEVEFYERTPDRRAWERVNDIMKRNGNKALSNVAKISIAGEIGMSTTGEFIKFCSTQVGVTPKTLLMTEDFDTEVGMELSMMTMQDLIYLSDRVVDYIKASDEIQEKKHQPTLNLVTSNIIHFMDWCETNENKEVVGSFLSRCKKEKPSIGFLFRNKTFLDRVIQTVSNTEIK